MSVQAPEIKETDVDLMDELLDPAENFDELREGSDDKLKKRRRKLVDGKDSLAVKADNENCEVPEKVKSKDKDSSQKPKKESRKKAKTKELIVGVSAEENGKQEDKEGDGGFDTRSEASSSHQVSEEPSMSEGSPNSSISRATSPEKQMPIERIVTTCETTNKIPDDKKFKDSAGKKKYDYVTKINYMFRDARFFLMKSNNADNITIAKQRAVWSTPTPNEGRLNQAFKEARNTILVFSIKESGRFCGFARLAAESRRDLTPVPWVLPPGLSSRALGGIFQIDWISKRDLSFNKTLYLYNPWNEGKPVKIGRDGQEIEPRVAEELCRLFPKDDSINLTPILHKSKRAASMMSAKGPLRRPLQYPGDRWGRSKEKGSFRGRSESSFRGAPGGGGSRKRRFDDWDYGPRSKRMRGFTGPRGRGAAYPRERMRDRSPTYRSGSRRSESYGGNDSHKLTYQDFMREMREFQGRPHATIPPMAFPPPPPFDPLAPPRYYDGPPAHDFTTSSRSRSEKRASADPYDRSVDEFLMRTRERSRDHSRERRYRERR